MYNRINSKTDSKIMPKRTVPVKPLKRSRPSPVPRKNPNAPKPGPKTIPVKPHKRTRPK
jgi:hypothetical protein